VQEGHLVGQGGGEGDGVGGAEVPAHAVRAKLWRDRAAESGRPAGRAGRVGAQVDLPGRVGGPQDRELPSRQVVIGG
jgi:hypothetical protein